MFFEHAVHGLQQPPNLRCDVDRRAGIHAGHGAETALQEPSISVAAVHQRFPGRVEAPAETQGSQTLLLRQS